LPHQLRWKLVAVFPIMIEDAGLHREHGVDFARQKVQLFQDTTTELLLPLKEAYHNQFTLTCVNEQVHTIKLVVAALLGEEKSTKEFAGW
jgi:hypothetical protein